MVGLTAIYGDGGAVCLDFDLACTLRLHAFEFKEARARDKSLAIEIANSVAVVFGGTSNETNGDTNTEGEIW